MGQALATEFKPLSQFEALLDFINALKFIASRLVQRVADLSAVGLSDEEKEVFKALEREKIEVLREIRKLIIFIRLQVASIKDIVTRKNVELNQFNNGSLAFHDLTYEGIPVRDELKRHAAMCNALSFKYLEFAQKIRDRNILNENLKFFVGIALMAAGGLAAVALLYVTIGMAAPLIVDITCISATSVFVCGSIVVGAIMVTPSEAERAQKYLKAVETNLVNVGFGLEDIISAFAGDSKNPTLMVNIEHVLTKIDLLSADIKRTVMDYYN